MDGCGCIQFTHIRGVRFLSTTQRAAYSAASCTMLSDPEGMCVRSFALSLYHSAPLSTSTGTNWHIFSCSSLTRYITQTYHAAQNSCCMYIIVGRMPHTYNACKHDSGPALLPSQPCQTCKTTHSCTTVQFSALQWVGANASGLMSPCAILILITPRLVRVLRTYKCECE